MCIIYNNMSSVQRKAVPFFKVWLFNIFEGQFSKAILCDDFKSAEDAIALGKSYLVGMPGSFFVVRSYKPHINNIVGGDFTTDTGETVYRSPKVGCAVC